MDNDQINTVLQDFGLSEPEIAVYLALLEAGTQTASVITKMSGLKRGHTYNVLESLTQKGIVQQFIKNRATYFTGRAPSTLMTDLEHRKESLEILTRNLSNIVPALAKIRNPDLLQPKVRFFQGVEGLKEIYEDTIRKKGQNLYSFGDFEYFFPEEQNKELNDWIWNYADRRAKKGIWYIGILNKSGKSDLAWKRRVKQKRKLKMLKDIYLPVEVNIYGNKVAITSTYRDMVGLIVEDAPIAETLRNFHQAVWGFLPDYKV